MTIFELDEITAKQLFNKIYGFRKREQGEWERTRLQCYYTVLPHLDEAHKNIQVSQFMPLPWDGEISDNWETIKADAADSRKRLDSLWAKIDGKE